LVPVSWDLERCAFLLAACSKGPRDRRGPQGVGRPQGPPGPAGPHGEKGEMGSCGNARASRTTRPAGSKKAIQGRRDRRVRKVLPGPQGPNGEPGPAGPAWSRRPGRSSRLRLGLHVLSQNCSAIKCDLACAGSGRKTRFCDIGRALIRRFCVTRETQYARPFAAGLGVCDVCRAQ
jgi:hypothetical protein